jgi:hypothetical protein
MAHHPRSVQIFLVVIVPVVFGLITGYFLGVSEVTYLILSVIGIAGGIGAGFDHLGARPGALRGVVGGLLFGGSILLAHEFHGAEAKAQLPEPAILLLVLTTGLGSAFGAIGGAWRVRAHRRTVETGEAG